MPTKIQGGLGIDKVQDGTVGMSSVDTELYGKITALTTINLGEAKTATGTFVDFDVPLGVKRITVMFDGVSTNGTSLPQIQIGTSGGFDVTGYVGAANQTWAGTTVISNMASGFLLQGATAATNTMSGRATLSLLNEASRLWLFDSCVGVIGAVDSAGGKKQLSAPLDRIRITTVNGTDLFDAGTINISWEF